MDHDGALICGTTALAVGPLAKWPGESPDLPWHYDLSGYRGPLAPEQVLSAFDKAWGYWAEVVDIRPRRVNSRAEAKVWGTFGRIDGDSGVLAWSMLANDSNSPKEQRYDSGERWVVVNPDRPASGIDLVRVACHEIGHVLGLDHDRSTADALLRPSYSVSIPKPTDRDIQRLVGLGYKKRAAPPPPPPPADPPPVTGFRLALPGGGEVSGDYKTKTLTYPKSWVGRAV
ncbi:MAG: matrixin family metalloprotease [Gemmataceae bacterium]|nr:matrixin family metalloprotease [Gemmataceae bacterium]